MILAVRLPGRFAFYDTETNHFLEAQGEQTWATFPQFESAAKRAEWYSATIARCREALNEGR